MATPGHNKRATFRPKWGPLYIGFTNTIQISRPFLGQTSIQPQKSLKNGLGGHDWPQDNMLQLLWPCFHAWRIKLVFHANLFQCVYAFTSQFANQSRNRRLFLFRYQCNAMLLVNTKTARHTRPAARPCFVVIPPQFRPHSYSGGMA